jgi:hypothetical protein
MPRDRKTTADIEITPEMIEAGVAVLYRFERYYHDEDHWAEEVYRAMEEKRREVER